MQNNIETATEASALALTRSEVIIRNVFSFCSDPLAFRQVCKAFYKTLESVDYRLWVKATSSEGCVTGFFYNTVTPEAKALWVLADDARLAEWYKNSLYSFLLTDAAGASKEMCKKSSGACVALASKYNDIKYLDICEDKDSIHYAVAAWESVPMCQLIDVLVSLLATTLTLPKMNTIELIAGMLFNSNNEKIYTIISDSIKNVPDSHQVSQNLLRVYDQMYDDAGIFITELIFETYGMNACIFFKFEASEDLYDVAYPILKRMFDEGYKPEFKNTKEKTYAYNFYKEMAELFLYVIEE